MEILCVIVCFSVALVLVSFACGYVGELVFHDDNFFIGAYISTTITAGVLFALLLASKA